MKMMDIEKQRVKLTLWDTAGQERFRTLTSSYYRGAHGVILVYDVTSHVTFAHLQDVWMKELTTYANTDEMVLMVIANKVDKTRTVQRTEGEQLARELNALYMECSAKTKIGINAAFEELVYTIMHSPRLIALRKEAGQANSPRRFLQTHDENDNTGPCQC